MGIYYFTVSWHTDMGLPAPRWGLIVDAKARNRRPDGSIITAEEEEAERAALGGVVHRTFREDKAQPQSKAIGGCGRY